MARAWKFVAVAVCLAFVHVAYAKELDREKLHLPSPDWRDQIIYFALTDRFDDGDPSNNDLGAQEYRPGDASHYQGGDIAGLIRRLEYVRGLGATALWITPPVLNQWRNPTTNYTGYHGYWASNFKEIDPHLGTLDDYRRLSHELHARGMYLVQDIVLNHTGDFFHYTNEWSAADPGRGYVPNTRSLPVTRPTQWPFSLNDPRQENHRAEAAYHWTPDISNNGIRSQELNYQLSGLDDINTESAAVRRALRDSYGHWIKEVGVDAFRVDTAFYVPPELFDDFLLARDAREPGVRRVAASTGRTKFLVFGEGFGIDRPGDETQMRRIEAYVRGSTNQARMDGMLNFPLYGSLGDSFARGRPTSELADRITRMMKVHRNPHLMPSFVDNHDVDRWLAGAGEPSLKQAVLAIMTLPGIPVLYYGTEQGLAAQRAPMFTPGVPDGPTLFDTTAPLYRYVAAASALRRSNPVLSRGTPVLLRDTPTGPGALVWAMRYKRDVTLVVFNSADHEVLIDRLDTHLPAGTHLTPLFGIHGNPAAMTVDSTGRVTLKVPARGGLVWRAGVKGPAPKIDGALTIGAPPPHQSTGDFVVSGQARPDTRVAVVIDGDLGSSIQTKADGHGRWSANVDTRNMIDPAATHRLVAWDGHLASSTAHEFRVNRSWRIAAELTDPSGDDAGPEGRYLYPTDPSFAPGQMDIRRIHAETSGGALRLTLTMNAFSHVWNPANGFDHVAFSIFVELPNTPGGVRALPHQDAEMPEGMSWHRRLRVHGWSNAMFASTGASANTDGTAASPAALITSNPDARTVVFTLPARSLGNPESLQEARLFITTWDYDGGYRALSPTPGAFTFGGGTAGEPKWMDSAIVELH